MHSHRHLQINNKMPIFNYFKSTFLRKLNASVVEEKPEEKDIPENTFFFLNKTW